MLTPREKIQKAITRARGQSRFYSALLMMLRLRESSDLQTLATDGESLLYNRVFVEQTPLTTLITAVLHEAGHVAHMHPARGKTRDAGRWNVAADYVVNFELANSGHRIPRDWLFTPEAKGRSTEQLYAALPPPPPQGGSGVGAGCGCVRPAPGKADAAHHAAQKMIGRAAAVVRGAGIGDPFMDRALAAIAAPRLPWYDLTRQWLRETATRAPSWRRVARRWINRGIVLPARAQPVIGTLAVAVDTSGSIDDRTLATFSKHMTDLVAELQPESVIVMYCDADIRGEPAVYAAGEMPDLSHALGGGGTDFRPPFAWIDAQGHEPAGLIYLTDLCALEGCFPEDPGYPVLWVSTGLQAAPCGDVVRIDVG